MMKLLNLYINKDFDKSLDFFSKALSIKSNDPASADLINRIKKIKDQKIDENWDGSITLLEK